MSNADFLSKAINIVKKAIEADTDERYQDAFKFYQNSLDYFMMALKYERNQANKDMIRNKVVEYLQRAEQLKQHIEGQNKKPQKAALGADAKPSTEEGSRKEDDAETKELKGALSSAIVAESPNVKWEDVAGLEGAKEALKEAVLLPLKLPHLFSRGRKPWAGILLYGPPGTGKSFLAKAVATEAKSTFFSVSSSDLVSKWMGQSEKLVKQLFNMARQNKPAIIFIDEIDALTGTRGEGESEASRRIKTEFLVQMNGVGNDTQGVLVLGATNIPWALDTAIRRRFEKRIYIPLPDPSARAKMFQLNLGDLKSDLTAKDFRRLAEMTDGYSGSDIAVAVRDAIMEPVRKIHTATHFKKILVGDQEKYTPCSPGDAGAQEMTWQDVDGDTLQEPDLLLKDFIKAVKSARPTLNQADIQRHIDFTKEYGQEG